MRPFITHINIKNLVLRPTTKLFSHLLLKYIQQECDDLFDGYLCETSYITLIIIYNI